jgi:hypothetical protein
MPMLRFSYYRSDDDEQWNLFGQLSGPWADELRSVWQRLRRGARRAHAVVNLKEVTLIDGTGEQLLAEMRREGADLVAAAVLREQLGGGTYDPGHN